mmetsp:Transcript_29697/g.91848  ORF Transcript_29697/g.91848 Transcript_29697/m.91848 type:complete len:212 (-) Transcript_29697:594-1229(-)
MAPASSSRRSATSTSSRMSSTSTVTSSSTKRFRQRGARNGSAMSSGVAADRRASGLREAAADADSRSTARSVRLLRLAAVCVSSTDDIIVVAMDDRLEPMVDESSVDVSADARLRLELTSSNTWNCSSAPIPSMVHAKRGWRSSTAASSARSRHDSSVEMRSSPKRFVVKTSSVTTSLGRPSETITRPSVWSPFASSGSRKRRSTSANAGT